MNVSFKIGEVVNGWTCINVNGLTHFVFKKDNIRIFFETNAGEGTNYSMVRAYSDETTGRTYKAMRFLHKYVSLVQAFSNVLYDRYYEENMELFGVEDVEPLGDTDITHKWVVIKPDYMFKNWKPEYITKSHQLVLATGGFGCKGAALSWGGGKVFTTDGHGVHDQPHRINILGIAKPHVLNEFGIVPMGACPQCGTFTDLDALSRDNEDICSDCARKESLSEFFG